MSYLLDTNICSAHLKRPAGLAHRFIQYGGRLYLPTIVLGELYAWAYRRTDPTLLLQQIEDELLVDIDVLEYDRACAEMFGKVRGLLLRQGVVVSAVDMMIAAVALAHNFTLVTHNTKDFQNIPGLALEDWLAT
jgi:tRNA(fMet)-specific endonuclease VapC